MKIMNRRKIILIGVVLGLSVAAVMGYSPGAIRYAGVMARNRNDSVNLDPVYSGSPVYNGPGSYGNRPYNYGSIRSAPIGVQPLPGSMNIGGSGFQRTSPGPPQLPYGFQNPTLQPQTYAAPAYSYRPVTAFIQQPSQPKTPGIIMIRDKDGNEIPQESTVVDPMKDPFVLLRRMSDFLGGLQNFRIGTQDTYDEVLLSGEKIQLSSWRSFHVSRPDKLVSDIQGDLANKRLWYDGKTVVLLDRAKNVYGSFKFSGTIDDMVDMATNQYHLSGPFMDLVCSDIYTTVAERIQDGEYVGRHKVDQYECDHLAFTNANVDFEIWIQAGDKPLPRKFTITYKNREGKPRYTGLLPYWELDIKFSADFFTFVPPAGARPVELMPVTTTDDKLNAAETLRERGNK